MLSKNPGLVLDGSLVTITPNHREFSSLCKALDIIENDTDAICQLSRSLNSSLVLLKGKEDRIAVGNDCTQCGSVSSPRRCGGQGDLLTGILATCWHWERYLDRGSTGSCVSRRINATLNSCLILRSVASKTYTLHGRSVLATDILHEIKSWESH
jgi:ATP-dependent NAD(P)H-hydrate dehydratase